MLNEGFPGRVCCFFHYLPPPAWPETSLKAGIPFVSLRASLDVLRASILSHFSLSSIIVAEVTYKEGTV